MYIIIADSGSTKTDWVLLEGKKIVKELKTIGFNPYFQSKELISQILSAELKPALEPWLKNVTELHYYGTGCSTEENCLLIEESIRSSIGISKITVAHDLLAAARALCKREAGIAAILGTGSNSCLYDGKKILENVPSTGYLWADYGGGSQIGKYFIRDYFEDRLPTDIRKAFEDAGFNREEILNNVYKNAVPSKYLASVSLFLSKHVDHPTVLNVLTECFNSFFEQQINKYSDSKRYKVHTVGSVGYYYKNLIAIIAERHGYTMGTVIQSPMEGLIGYHTQL